MTEAKYLLVVRFWVAPEAVAQVSRWLEGGHVTEVVSQPGFLWCRRLHLKEKDAKGWSAFSMLYGMESRHAFEKYESNQELKSKFACGGTAKDGFIMLQGDHRDDVKGYLVKMGFNETAIEVM